MISPMISREAPGAITSKVTILPSLTSSTRTMRTSSAFHRTGGLYAIGVPYSSKSLQGAGTLTQSPAQPNILHIVLNALARSVENRPRFAGLSEYGQHDSRTDFAFICGQTSQKGAKTTALRPNSPKRHRRARERLSRGHASQPRLRVEARGRRNALPILRRALCAAFGRRVALQDFAPVPARNSDRALSPADQARIYSQAGAFHRRGERRK